MKIKTALISVSDKTGIVEFAKFLSASGVEIFSTGGTAKFLRDAGVRIVDVSELTGFPEIMDGRVKTLHPKVHGGILGKRTDKAHVDAAKKHDISWIDMVVVNLYPFEQTVQKGADFDECVENIDIGGPSMIRSAAKNHNDVVVVVEPSSYQIIMEEMKNGGIVSADTRKKLAMKAFAKTARYDGAIANWLQAQSGDVFGDSLNACVKEKTLLRYGENPHQKAALYVLDNPVPGVASARQIQGKELSYNNIADTDAAFDLVSEFSEPAVAIIKHANPCGVAVGNNLSEAYEKALASDPVSAYGGIIAFNRKIDGDVAELVAKLFVEVIIAPDADEKALEIIGKKKNLRLLLTGEMPELGREDMLVKSVAGGLLVQTRDNIILNKNDLKIVTKRKPTDKEMEDLIFAFTVCKHTKSNAIVLVKDKATIGVGAGQMSRIDSSRIASWKAKETATSVPDAKGSVLASDAFFPFADGLISAAESGITAVIQPGGSIRDDEVIKAADERNIAMVFTGIRHFRH